jgi:hypothetical protein
VQVSVITNSTEKEDSKESSESKESLESKESPEKISDYQFIQNLKDKYTEKEGS